MFFIKVTFKWTIIPHGKDFILLSMTCSGKKDLLCLSESSKKSKLAKRHQVELKLSKKIYYKYSRHCPLQSLCSLDICDKTSWNCTLRKYVNSLQLKNGLFGSFSLKDIIQILQEKYLFRRKEGYCGPDRSTDRS